MAPTPENCKMETSRGESRPPSTYWQAATKGMPPSDQDGHPSKSSCVQEDNIEKTIILSPDREEARGPVKASLSRASSNESNVSHYYPDDAEEEEVGPCELKNNTTRADNNNPAASGSRSTKEFGGEHPLHQDATIEEGSVYFTPIKDETKGFTETQDDTAEPEANFQVKEETSSDPEIFALNNNTPDDRYPGIGTICRSMEDLEEEIVFASCVCSSEESEVEDDNLLDESDDEEETEAEKEKQLQDAIQSAQADTRGEDMQGQDPSTTTWSDDEEALDKFDNNDPIRRSMTKGELQNTSHSTEDENDNDVEAQHSFRRSMNHSHRSQLPNNIQTSLTSSQVWYRPFGRYLSLAEELQLVAAEEEYKEELRSQRKLVFTTVIGLLVAGGTGGVILCYLTDIGK